MENNELFQTIERFKETLSDIVSARKQVSETVNAYGKTQIEIRSYIDNLNQIETAISSLITLLQNNKSVVDIQSANAVNNLKNSCEVILNQVRNEFAMTSKHFADNTGKYLSAMSSQIEKFELSIEKSNTLTNKVESTSMDVSTLIDSVESFQRGLVNSQKLQDEAIESIGEKLCKANLSLSKQEEVLNLQGQTLDTIAESISKSYTSITDELSRLSSSIEASSSKILKGININRFIIISAFILLAILQCVFKWL